MSEIILQTESADQTRDLAARIAKHLPRPTVVALSGQLGAGKTHFIKGLGQGLGLDPRKICSATFVLIAEYGEEPKLIHIDAYRIDEPEEMENIGWYELIDEADSLIAVEWAEKIQPILPPDHLEVRIEILDDHRRQFTLRPTGANCENALSAALAQS